jgi:site-specific recombinase XerD
VQTWLAAAEICTGPVFRPVLRGGHVQAVPLTPHSAGQIVKRYANCAGLDPAAYAARSLRSGFLTSAAEAGVSTRKLS